MKTFIYLLLIVSSYNVAIAQDKLGNVVEGKRKALVIGNLHYTQDPLNNTLRDADSMEVALKYLGFEVKKLNDGNYDDMKRYIDNFIKSLSINDVAFFFYSGHGAAFEKENYLIPIDFEFKCLEELKYKSIKVSDIANRASARKVRNVFIVLDACRDEFPDMECVTSDDKRGKKNRPLFVRPESNPSGSMIAFSTNYGNTSTDKSVKDYNGLYTESLLEYIRKPIGFREILDEARVRTRRFSILLRPGKPEQRPQVEYDIDGNFFFLKDKTQTDIPEEMERQKRDTEANRNDNHNKKNETIDPVAQGPKVQNIYHTQNNTNKPIEIHYTLTDDVWKIQLNIKKKEANTYISKPLLKGDIGENIVKGEKVIYWAPAKEDKSGFYNLDFSLFFYNNPGYLKCLALRDEERRKFNKGKRKKAVSWLLASPVPFAVGEWIHVYLKRETLAFNDRQRKIYDENGNSIIDDNAQKPTYDAEREEIEQKLKMKPYAIGLKYASYALFSVGVSKYIFKKFKGVDCAIIPDFQGGQTIKIIKKF